MRKQMKKILAMICAVTLLVTGLGFMPQSAKADDTWFDAVFDTPETDPPTPWNHHHTDATAAGAEDGIWDYTGPNGYEVKYKGGDNVEGFAWHITKKKSEANWLKTDDLMDVACVKKDGEWVKPTPGMKYKLNMTIDYSNHNNGETHLQIWETNGSDENKDLEAHCIFNPAIGNVQWSCSNVDVFVKYDSPLQIGLGIGVSDKYVYNGKITTGCIFTISKFELIPDGSYEVVPKNQEYNPTGTPWTLAANWIPDTNPDLVVDNGSYGLMGYHVDTDAGASKVSSTEMLLLSTVGEPETEGGQRITDPAKRWWWIYGKLKNYASTAGLKKWNHYTATIKVNSSKATPTGSKLFVTVNGIENEFSLTEGSNTLTIPEFKYFDEPRYSGQEVTNSDITFLFDELAKNTTFSVESIEFTNVDEENGWTNVPNKYTDYEAGPWSLNATALDDSDKGMFGAMQYKANKANPSTYADYTMKVLSNSSWYKEGGELMWSCFAKLDGYMEDYLDKGNQYTLRLTINSSKATAVDPDNPDNLHKLVVVVGSERFERDLVAGDQTLTINGTYDYVVDRPNEHLILELDGLQKDTEITLKNIEVTSPNNGWTTIPASTGTQVGAWRLYAKKDDEHGSKLAYKTNTQGSGLSQYDIKVRRTTSNGAGTSMAALATLTNYLKTAKDTKGNALKNGESYNTKITIKTSSYNNQISNYGKVRAMINDQPFLFNLRSGEYTYDLEDITGQRFDYDNSEGVQNVTFELDEVTPGAILNISQIQFVPDEEGYETISDGEGKLIEPVGVDWSWFVYALTDAAIDKYGSIKYMMSGDQTKLSSLKTIISGVSGDFEKDSVKVTLRDCMTGLTKNKQYKLVAKVHIDESKVAPADKTVSYDKKLRIVADGTNLDFPVANNANDTYTFEGYFTYKGNLDSVQFAYDQMLKGTRVYVESVEFIDPLAPTTTVETSTNPTTSATTTNPESSSVNPDTSSINPETTKNGSGDVTKPGKANIKKVYKKKKSAKKLKIKLKKVKSAVGYQVAVFKSKKKAKKAKKPLVKKYTKKLTIKIKSKKLKNKKKLYVRARAYVINLNNAKLFGKWGNIKKVKIKK